MNSRNAWSSNNQLLRMLKMPVAKCCWPRVIVLSPPCFALEWRQGDRIKPGCWAAEKPVEGQTCFFRREQVSMYLNLQFMCIFLRTAYSFPLNSWHQHSKYSTELPDDGVETTVVCRPARSSSEWKQSQVFKRALEEGFSPATKSQLLRPLVQFMFSQLPSLPPLACLQANEVLFLKWQSLLSPLAGNQNASLIV